MGRGKYELSHVFTAVAITAVFVFHVIRHQPSYCYNILILR
jgi:hypothetical protein